MALEPAGLDRRCWIRLCERLGAGPPAPSVFAGLAAAYAEPARAYHTTEHIRDCLAQFDSARRLAGRPDEVEAGLWFHDAVYDPRRSDNEDRSAALAQSALTDMGVPRPVARRVAGLVLATKHLVVPLDPDARLTCDIDLSILGRQPGEFADFERRIRQEYSWVPEELYRRSRAEVLAGFLARESIYQTEPFRRLYESPARENLKRLRAQLIG